MSERKINESMLLVLSLYRYMIEHGADTFGIINNDRIKMIMNSDDGDMKTIVMENNNDNKDNDDENNKEEEEEDDNEDEKEDNKEHNRADTEDNKEDNDEENKDEENKDVKDTRIISPITELDIINFNELIQILCGLQSITPTLKSNLNFNIESFQGVIEKVGLSKFFYISETENMNKCSGIRTLKMNIKLEHANISRLYESSRSGRGLNKCPGCGADIDENGVHKSGTNKDEDKDRDSKSGTNKDEDKDENKDNDNGELNADKDNKFDIDKYIIKSSANKEKDEDVELNKKVQDNELKYTIITELLEKQIIYNFQVLLLHCFGNFCTNYYPYTSISKTYDKLQSDISPNIYVNEDMMNHISGEIKQCKCKEENDNSIVCDIPILTCITMPHICLVKNLQKVSNDLIPNIKCLCCFKKCILDSTNLDKDSIHIISKYNIDVYPIQEALLWSLSLSLNNDSFLLQLFRKAIKLLMYYETSSSSWEWIKHYPNFQLDICFYIMKFITIYSYKPRLCEELDIPPIQDKNYFNNSKYIKRVFENFNSQTIVAALDIFFEMSTYIMDNMGIDVFLRLAKITKILHGNGVVNLKHLQSLVHFLGKDRVNVKSGLCVSFLDYLGSYKDELRELYLLSLPRNDGEKPSNISRKIYSKEYIQFIYQCYSSIIYKFNAAGRR